MRNGIMAAAVAALLGVSTMPALAGTPYRAEATCPVDGKKFTWTSTASYSTWGMELDGKPIGSWNFPMPIPQCPGSGFPVYREFSAREVEAIRALVQTPEYDAIKDETSYYVLAFVVGKLDADFSPWNRAWVLLKATWQARGDDAQYARYATETLEALDAALPSVREKGPAEWRGTQIIAANVERQAGRFEAATARLDGLDSQARAEGEDDQDQAVRIALTRRLIAERDTRPNSPPDRFGRSRR